MAGVSLDLGRVMSQIVLPRQELFIQTWHYHDNSHTRDSITMACYNRWRCLDRLKERVIRHLHFWYLVPPVLSDKRETIYNAESRITTEILSVIILSSMQFLKVFKGFYKTKMNSDQSHVKFLVLFSKRLLIQMVIWCMVICMLKFVFKLNSSKSRDWHVMDFSESVICFYPF